MIVFVIVFLIAVVATIACGYIFGFLRIEKVELEVDDAREDLPEIDLPLPQEGEGDGAPLIDLDDGISLKEKMHLEDHSRQSEQKSEGAQEGEEKQETEKKKGAGSGDGSLFEYEEEPSIDRITGYTGGRQYILECKNMLAKAKEEGAIIAAAYFDIDRFRFINSLKGLSIGDYVLTRLGHELHTVFPENSLITRVSADHFYAVFPVSSMDMFEICAARLQEVCESLRSDIGIKSGLRVSLGIATTEIVDRDYDVNVLLHKANLARHCIKISRADTWKMFEDAMVTSNLYGESALEDYNENQYDEDFVIYYSPQQDLALRHAVGCEAIVRWACEESDTDSSVISSTLPRKAKIPSNGTKVVYQVCRSMSRWRKAGKQVQPVGVSIPATEFFKQDFDEFLGRCLSEFQLEPQWLAIVVDAAMLRIDWSASSKQLKRIHELGVLIGVDEIDMSYRELEFLNNLPVNFIKLHSSYSSNIADDEQQQAGVRRMLSHAGEKNIRVIVEGVDTEGQADALQGLGVSEVQGAYCGRPDKAEAYVHGLPEYVEKHFETSPGTVILDDKQAASGNFNLF